MVSDGSFPQEDFKTFVPAMQSQSRRERARARKYVRRRRDSDLVVPLIPIPEPDNNMLSNLKESSNRNLISSSQINNNKPIYIPAEAVSPTTNRAHGSSKQRIEPSMESINLENPENLDKTKNRQFDDETTEKVNLDTAGTSGKNVQFEPSGSVVAFEKQGNALFIVEPQEDFQQNGSLPTVDAATISQRISSFLLENMEDIDQIYISMNSRREFNISHSTFWVDGNREHPKAFQQLELEDIKNGKWTAVHEEHQEWISQYVDILIKKGRRHLAIWPEHCIVGTRSSSIMKNIMTAVKKWELYKRRSVRFILKGKNSLTEQYSAFQAEVPIDGDTSTHMNVTLLEELKNFERVIICGFAATDGVKHTVLDLANRWTEGDMDEIIILGNAISCIRGNEERNEMFLEEMEMARGLTIDTTDLQLRNVLATRRISEKRSKNKEGENKIIGKSRFREHDDEAAVADEVDEVKKKKMADSTRRGKDRPSRFKWTRTFHGSYKRAEILDSTTTL